MDPINDDEDDRDHPLQEPEFVIHAVDDDRRRRAHLPAQLQQPPPRDDRRYAARIERMHYYMLFPQAVLTSWSMLLGCMMLFYAARPAERQPDHFSTIWIMVLTSLIMLFMLLTLLLSYLGVYGPIPRPQ